MSDELRVTVVATGLGQPAAARNPKPLQVVPQKTGTDNMPVLTDADTGYAGDLSGVIKSRRQRASTIEALQNSGMDKLDIPAFLRKQAD
jgi:cell division protein FtsZ